MRLVNVNTLLLEEYFEDETPTYAVISHTWGEESEELTFRHLKDAQSSTQSCQSLGMEKLRGSCRQAKRDGIEHVWIDTCCIDKTNSVELSEAINSMFRWYSQAQICYAYLSDVPTGDNPRHPDSKFMKSRWFERGWTLQELLAPERMRFYDLEWNFLGTKDNLSAWISKAAGIPRRFILGLAGLKDASVAQRMSWAAQRRTKRPEDIAYCLLGIFDVSMPMVYGEGRQHAFFRLQEQIIRSIRDDSILAWGLAPSGLEDHAEFTDQSALAYGKALAEHPSDFINCGGISRGNRSDGLTYALEISGNGIRANLALHEPPTDEVFAILRCYPESDSRSVISIPLVPTVDNPPSVPPCEFIRPHGRRAFFSRKSESPLPIRSIYIPNVERPKHVRGDGLQPYWFLIEGEDSAFDSIEVEPSSSLHMDRSLISITTLECDASIIVRLCSRDKEKHDLIVKIVLVSDGLLLRPECFALRSSRKHALETIASSLRGVPHNRMQQQVLIGDRLYTANIISAGDTTIQNLFILDIQAVQASVSIYSQHLDMDEELDKCLARCRVDTTEEGVKPTKRRFVKIPCPGQGCTNGAREWVCDTCHACLEYGYTDEYFYCDCGRNHYQNFDFKCSLSAHGPAFVAYEQKILEQLLKSLDPGSYINILILGETGVGKSTFINAFVNYLAYSTLDEAIAADKLDWVIPSSFSTQVFDRKDPAGRIKECKIVVGRNNNEEHDGSKGQSATQMTVVYAFTIGNRVLRLIDTVGIGDTRGVEYDKRNMADTLETLRSYDSLHGILILAKSNTPRLTLNFSFCMKEILMFLHRSATTNIAFGFTNTRSTNYTPGDSYGVMKRLLDEYQEAGLSLELDNVYCFDSESFRYLAALRDGVKIGNVTDFRRSWERSRMETWRLIKHCAEKSPHDIASMISLHTVRQQTVELSKAAADIFQVIKRLDYREDIGRQPAASELGNSHIRHTIGAYEDELSKIRDAAAQLNIFLKANSIAPYNDQSIEYLDYCIRQEEVKVQHGGAPSKLATLQALRETQVKYTVAMASDAKSDPKSSSTQPLNEAGINHLFTQLYDLKHFGQALWDVTGRNANAGWNIYREKQYKWRAGAAYYLGERGFLQNPH